MDPNEDPNEPPPPGQGKRVRGPCPGAAQPCGQDAPDAAPFPATDHPGIEARYPCAGPRKCTGREVCGREPVSMIPCPGRGVCGRPQATEPRKRGPCRGPGVCGTEEPQYQPEPEKPKRGPCLGPVCGSETQPEQQYEPEQQLEQERPKRGPCGGDVCGPGAQEPAPATGPERDRSRRGPCPGPVCDTDQAPQPASPPADAQESPPPDICLGRSFCDGLAVCPETHPFSPNPPPDMCLRTQMCRETDCPGETTCIGPGASAGTCVPCQEGFQKTTDYEGEPQPAEAGPESGPQTQPDQAPEELSPDLMICASVRVQKKMEGAMTLGMAGMETSSDTEDEKIRLGIAGWPAAHLCRDYGCPVGAGPGEPVPLCEGPGLCDGSADCPACYDGQPSPPPPPPPQAQSDGPCVGHHVCTACGGGATNDQNPDTATATAPP